MSLIKTNPKTAENIQVLLKKSDKKSGYYPVKRAFKTKSSILLSKSLCF